MLSGVTTGGNPITFERSGNSVKGVRAYIPTTCVPAWPGFSPRFSYQTVGYTTSYVLIAYVCRGDATFKARPVRR